MLDRRCPATSSHSMSMKTQENSYESLRSRINGATRWYPAALMTYRGSTTQGLRLEQPTLPPFVQSSATRTAEQLGTEVEAVHDEKQE